MESWAAASGRSARAVSLGRVRSTKSKDVVLAESRRRREERAALFAPTRSATVLATAVRALLARRAFAHRVRRHMLAYAASQKDRSACLSIGCCTSKQAARTEDSLLSTTIQPSGGTSRASLERSIALLWSCTRGAPKQQAVDAKLVDCICEQLEPLRVPVCVCESSDGTAWLRRTRRLVEPLLHAVACVQSVAAARHLSVACGAIQLEQASWSPCSHLQGAALERQVLDAAAKRLLAALGSLLVGSRMILHAAYGPDAQHETRARDEATSEVALLLLQPARLALQLNADDHEVSNKQHHLMCDLVAAFRPLSLLAHPPQSSRRAIVLDLFSRVRPSACGQLESAIAMQLLQPKEQAALAVGFSRHEFAAVVAATMRVCFGGEGCDWRAGGWTEGSPRTIDAAQMQKLLDVQVSRLRQRRPALTAADATWLLVRHKWDLANAESAAPIEDVESEVSLDSVRDGAARASDRPSAPVDVVAAAQAEAGTRCGICFDEPADCGELTSLSCGHGYCGDCWRQLLCVALKLGASCVHAQCPEVGCNELISGTMWFQFLDSASMRHRLDALMRRSFVEANQLLSWCPNGSCGMACALVTRGCPVATCVCGSTFCCGCADAAHFPATCAQRAKWSELLKQSPDAQFLVQHTRPCPTCGARTQRDKGCMHMVCTQCAQAWCWACGQKGKNVHHAHACTRKPDPSWKFEAEERKLLDGSFSGQLDVWLYRAEQLEMLEEYVGDAISRSPGTHPNQPTTAFPGEVSHTAALPAVAAARSASCTSRLRADVAWALRLLQWAQVLAFFNGTAGAQMGGVRLALAQLEACTDWLLEHALQWEMDGRHDGGHDDGNAETAARTPIEPFGHQLKGSGTTMCAEGISASAVCGSATKFSPTDTSLASSSASAFSRGLRGTGAKVPEPAALADALARAEQVRLRHDWLILCMLFLRSQLGQERTGTQSKCERVLGTK